MSIAPVERIENSVLLSNFQMKKNSGKNVFQLNFHIFRIVFASILYIFICHITLPLSRSIYFIAFIFHRLLCCHCIFIVMPCIIVSSPELYVTSSLSSRGRKYAKFESTRVIMDRLARLNGTPLGSYRLVAS